MSANLSKYVAAAALSAAVAFGGWSIAGAQDDGTTTETPEAEVETPEAEAPEAGAERPRKEGCDRDSDAEAPDAQGTSATTGFAAT